MIEGIVMFTCIVMIMYALITYIRTDYKRM